MAENFAAAANKDDGPLIRYERLRLRFTCNDVGVERIVGVITLFTEATDSMRGTC
jgi:hypothetical protein